MTWLGQLDGIIALLAVPALTAVGALLVRKSSRESNSTEQWKALFEGHQEWTRDQLAEQDTWTKERLAERDEKISALERDVHELSERFSALDEKYRAALAYIRQLWNLLTTVLDREDVPVAPEKITPDL